MHLLKRLANGMTWLRLVLAFVILILAIVYGREAFEPALKLLLVAWFTDRLDGALARHSGQADETWIGRHDALVDLGLASAVWILLTTAGFVHPLVAIPYLLIWFGIFWHQQGYVTPQPALFGAVIYGWTILEAFRHVPNLGWALVGWLLLATVGGGERFWRVRVPGFFRGLERMLRPEQSKPEREPPEPMVPDSNVSAGRVETRR
ncbi:MAG: CDP-alcohol phosphatidyltransferase family protein [Anaerolineae bacterium]